MPHCRIWLFPFAFRFSLPPTQCPSKADCQELTNAVVFILRYVIMKRSFGSLSLKLSAHWRPEWAQPSWKISFVTSHVPMLSFFTKYIAVELAVLLPRLMICPRQSVLQPSMQEKTWRCARQWTRVAGKGGNSKENEEPAILHNARGPSSLKRVFYLWEWHKLPKKLWSLHPWS